MLDFAILALPRSGTTWAANWLTTDESICWHDPIAHSTPHEIEKRQSSARYRGISCTGSWMFDWTPPARTLILERPIAEVQASLSKLGLPEMPADRVWQFKMLDGLRVASEALFDERAKDIWGFLLPDVPFNEERHRELVQMNIQPDFNYTPDTAKLRGVLKELMNE